MMQELPWRTLLLLGVGSRLYLGLGAVPVAWVYARDAVVQGEVWRLLTGHWVHSNDEHAFWNLVALLILGALFEKCLKWHLLTVLLVGMGVIGGWLWVMMPAMLYYSGLSGILNSLLAAGIGYEVIFARGLFVHTDWVAVPQVHVVGGA